MIKKADKKVNLYIYISLAVVTFGVYLRVLGNDFVNYDDNEYVTENSHIQAGLTWNSIKWAFTTNHVGNWHPMTWLSHMADCELFGLKAWGHHLVNLLMHIANTLILFAILNAMTGTVWRSAFVAAIFTLQPLNVESVAWIAEKKNVLSTMFWLLAIGSYWKYSIRQKGGWYLLTLLLFAMGLMSKPMLVTLPFTLLLLDYWPLERLKNLRDWKTILRLIYEKLPFFVLSVISGVITFIAQKAGGAVVTIDKVPLSIRLANAIVSYGKYILKSFWPIDLVVFYPLENHILVGEAIASAIVLAAISIFVIRFTKTNKYLPVGWLWYLGTLVPVIGIIQVGEQAMADRYAYVPMIGLLIMVGWGAWDLTEQLVNRKTILKMLAGCAIVILSILTYIQAGYWRSSITLFERAMSVVGDNETIYCNLSAAYNDSGRYKDAIQVSTKAIKLKPNDMDSYCNLGKAYFELGYFKEAVAAFQQGISINNVKSYPNLAMVYSNLGAAYSRLGQYKEAIEALKKSIEINPNDCKIYVNLCLTYSDAGRYEEAAEIGRKAIELAPTWSVAYYNLSIAYRKMIKYPEEIEALKRVVELDPNDMDAYSNMGVGYMNMGQYKEAVEALKKSVKIQPSSWKAHFNLGLAYAYMGNKDAAMKEYEVLKRLDTTWANRLLEVINK